MMISIVAVLLTTFLTVWLVSLINIIIATSIQRLSVFIIIPVGAIIVGASAASGIYIVRRLLKTELKFAYLFISLVIGIVAFFGVTYLDYKNSIASFIKEYSGSVSEKSLVAFKKTYTFNQYLEKIYKKTIISISSRRGRKAININNETVSMISFWFSVMGSAAGGFIIHRVAVNSRVRRGGYYLDLKYLQRTRSENYQNIEDMINRGSFNNEFIQMIEEGKVESSARQQVIVRIMKDRHKGDGIIFCQLLSGNGKQQKTINQIKNDITPEQTERIMASVLSVNPEEKF